MLVDRVPRIGGGHVLRCNVDARLPYHQRARKTYLLFSARYREAHRGTVCLMTYPPYALHGISGEVGIVTGKYLDSSDGIQKVMRNLLFLHSFPIECLKMPDWPCIVFKSLILMYGRSCKHANRSMTSSSSCKIMSA
jgi:hypothetical protein